MTSGNNLDVAVAVTAIAASVAIAVALQRKPIADDQP
jgi:hypothetical protein